MSLTAPMQCPVHFHALTAMRTADKLNAFNATSKVARGIKCEPDPRCTCGCGAKSPFGGKRGVVLMDRRGVERRSSGSSDDGHSDPKSIGESISAEGAADAPAKGKAA